MIKIIVAHDRNNLIGKDNKLPWHIPEDMEHFKSTTMNQIVVMGRKTFDSIFSYIKKPLPNRHNVVLTRDTNWSQEGVDVFHDFKSIIETFKDKDIIIIGGTEIYKMFLPYADELIITEVNGEYEGDAYFPDYRKNFLLNMERSDVDKFKTSKNGTEYSILYFERG